MKPSTVDSPQFLSHIALISLDHREIVPAGFTVIRNTPSGEDANLNPHSKGKSVYLCVKYSRRAMRITSLKMITQRQKEFDEGGGV